jgi:hypothetical protein
MGCPSRKPEKNLARVDNDPSGSPERHLERRKGSGSQTNRGIEMLKTTFLAVGITSTTVAAYSALTVLSPGAVAGIEGLVRDWGFGWDEQSCEKNPRACLTTRYEELERLEREVRTSTGAIRAELGRTDDLVAEQAELVARNGAFLDQGRNLYRQRTATDTSGLPLSPDAPVEFAGRTYPNLSTFRAQLELLFQEKVALDESLASARQLKNTLQTRLDALMVQEGQIDLAKRMIPAQLQLIQANRTLSEFGANVGMIDGIIRGSEAGLTESRALIATTRDLMEPPTVGTLSGSTREAFDRYLGN